MKISGIINEAIIQQTAKLAKLHLSEKDAKNFVTEFNSIFEMFKQLEEASKQEVALSVEQIQFEENLRPDIATSSKSPDLIQNFKCKNVNDILPYFNEKEGLFVVPKAIEDKNK